MLRHTVQFHWTNATPAYSDFEQFLATLTQDKRKKIRQERRKVRDAGVKFIHKQGGQILSSDGIFSTAAMSAPTWSTATRPT